MVNNYTYDSEITFNNILGDMQIYWVSDIIDYDLKCFRKNFYRGYISELNYDIMVGLIDEFYYEFINIRMNEFDKWYNE